jgi:hypothetical protein
MVLQLKKEIAPSLLTTSPFLRFFDDSGACVSLAFVLQLSSFLQTLFPDFICVICFLCVSPGLDARPAHG